MANQNQHHGNHASFAHPASMKMLFGIFFTLVGLTILTVVANDWPLGKFDLVLALFIATIKATLVALFFMHLYWDKGFNILTIISPLFFAALFISLTLMDRGAYQNTMEDFPVSSRPDAGPYLPAPDEE